MRPIAVFDSETTGIDVENDRIVSAFIARVDGDGNVVDAHSWLVDPEIEIPAEATAVHGITTDQARMEGKSQLVALTEIEAIIIECFALGLPLVIYNAPFDLTILDRGLRRVRDLGLMIAPTPIIDPYVLDKAMDKFRKGPRTLSAVFEHHAPNRAAEIQWHGAEDDALAAGYLAQLLLMDYRLANAPLDDIHKWQITWKRRQQESFRDYLLGQGKDASDVSTEWPIVEWRTS